jgi:DNA-binding NtrC family response regulator
MRRTDTKPLDPPSRRRAQPVLRTAFSDGRVLPEAPLTRVSATGCPIGREVTGGLRLDDSRASRHHATVHRDPLGHLSIVDERSKNGTLVNGERVERRRLAPGDVLSVGDSCIVVAEDPGELADEPVEGLLGPSSSMRWAREQVRTLGPTHLKVLLAAETGCGKEVVARAIHRASAARGELVAVNCAAIPENLFESQLFGHVPGAFSGAVAHAGYFRAASGGTLFLDEIGELPLSLQPKLLRAIEERAVVPLGTTRPVPCAVRIVAATNRDLGREVERGAFRGDLLARLFEARIELPPLRDRREDILPLFLAGCGERPPPMSHALAQALLLHSWPFNVREVVSAARELCVGSPAKLEVGAFRRRLAAQGQTKTRAAAPAPAAPRAEGAVDALELRRLLEEHGGSVADVARAVGRSRRQVYRWMTAHGIDVATFRRGE